MTPITTLTIVMSILAIELAVLAHIRMRAVGGGRIVDWDPGLSFDGQSVEEREYSDHVPLMEEWPQREGMEVVSRQAMQVRDDLWQITWTMRFMESTQKKSTGPS